MHYCDICYRRLKYNRDYDSYFCSRCNQFKERKCNDPECVYCPERPDRPIKEWDNERTEK